jgi:hypothetical protein
MALAAAFLVLIAPEGRGAVSDATTSIVVVTPKSAN